MGSQSGKEADPKRKPTASELKTYLMVIQVKLTLYRNKKVDLIKKKKKEVAEYLKQNNLDIAKAKMDSIIREEDLITVYDIIAPLCEILKEKCTYLLQSKACPLDVRAPLDTIIYSSTRMEIEELHTLKKTVDNVYGSLYTTKALNNSDELVNVNVIEKLKVKPASDSYLMIRLKQIAKEFEIEIDFPNDIPVQQEIEKQGGMNQNYNPYDPMQNNPYDPMQNNPYANQENNNNINNGGNQGFNQYYNQSNPYEQGGFNNYQKQNMNNNPYIVNNNGFGNQNSQMNPQANFNPYNQPQEQNGFNQLPLNQNNQKPPNPDEPGSSYINDSPTIPKRDLGNNQGPDGFAFP